MSLLSRIEELFELAEESLRNKTSELESKIMAKLDQNYAALNEAIDNAVVKLRQLPDNTEAIRAAVEAERAAQQEASAARETAIRAEYDDTITTMTSADAAEDADYEQRLADSQGKLDTLLTDQDKFADDLGALAEKLTAATSGSGQPDVEPTPDVPAPPVDAEPTPDVPVDAPVEGEPVPDAPVEGTPDVPAPDVPSPVDGAPAPVEVSPGVPSSDADVQGSQNA